MAEIVGHMIRIGYRNKILFMAGITIDWGVDISV
jgi:hypothetical protein